MKVDFFLSKTLQHSSLSMKSEVYVNRTTTTQGRTSPEVYWLLDSLLNQKFHRKNRVAFPGQGCTISIPDIRIRHTTSKLRCG